jgi:hypothetical protein
MRQFYEIICVVLFVVTLVECGQWSESRQILATSKFIIKAIRNRDVDNFKAAIVHSDTLDRVTIGRDMAFYQEYLRDNFFNQDPPIEITNLFNSNYQRLVKIHFFRDPKDSLVKRGDLRLLFGPSDVAPLSKALTYETQEVDLIDSINFHPLSYWQSEKEFLH